MNINKNELKEASHHGTPDFPIQVYHPTGLFAYYHWHEECEFIYITSGSACIRIGVENFDIKEGQCVYIRPNTLHSITPEDTSTFDFYAVVFHPSLILSEIDICNHYLSTKYTINHRFIPSGNEQTVINHINSICKDFETKAFAYELKIKAKLYSIFSHIFEFGFYSTDEVLKNKKAVDKLEKVIKYINLNYQKNITIDELAHISGYSISHFSHFFKEITGKTPIEYINRQRILNACELLKQTDLSILEISFDCGFEHVGYFIKTFKRFTTYTPYKYKQKYSLL